MEKKTKPDLPDGTDWCAETREWFASWRDSPRTDGWDDPQWQFLFDTAIVHSLIYESMQFQWLQELRQRELLMGLTFDPKPKEDVKAEVTPIERVLELYQGGPRRKANA